MPRYLPRRPRFGDIEWDAWARAIEDIVRELPLHSVISTSDGPNSSGITGVLGALATDVGSSNTRLWQKLSGSTSTTGWEPYSSGTISGWLRPDAGTIAVNTSPLKFTSGPLNTTPEDGAIEYDGASFYASVDGARRSLTTGNDIRVADVTVANTTTETTIHTSEIAANALKAGKMYRITLLGKFSTNSGSDFFTLRFKMGSATLLTAVLSPANVANVHLWLQFTTTIRTIGASGTYAAHVEATLGSEEVSVTPVTGSVDTTVAENLTATVQWNSASAGNTLTVMQSSLEVISKPG